MSNNNINGRGGFSGRQPERDNRDNRDYRDRNDGNRNGGYQRYNYEYNQNPNFGPGSNNIHYNRPYPQRPRYPRPPHRPYIPYIDPINAAIEEEEYKEKREKVEDERNFRNKFTTIIELIDKAFDSQITEEEILNIIKALLKMPSLTIFEAMNLIYRHVKIYRALTYYKTKDDMTIYLNDDIFENWYPGEYPSTQSNKIIENYKINKKDENSKTIENDEFLYEDDKDRRRRISKNYDDIYNYLPILEDDKNFVDEEYKKRYAELNIFAKNENEVNYHPLFYKTIMCHICDQNTDNFLIEPLCPYSHNIQDDFKIIYDYKDSKICKLMNVLNDCKLFNFENYLKYIPKTIKFDKIDLKSFKVHKCLLDKECPTDYHLCPFYHESKKDIDAQRRPQFLFRYSSEMCGECFDKCKKKYIVKKCKNGDFCNNIHNKNEYNYHLEHFGKTYKCTRNPKGTCPFIKTCYGIHKEKDESEEEDEEEKEDEEIIIDENEIEKDDKEIREIKDKIKTLLQISKNVRCRQCNGFKGVICYFIECKHFMCCTCFKKLFNEFKKNKKENKKLECPFCNKELSEGKSLIYDFLKN